MAGNPLNPMAAHAQQGDESERLAALWTYLSSWIAPDGGVNGPVVHRCDLKRMFAIHDTPWTQGAVIEGLVWLYKRSGRGQWLARAIRLAEAQASRLGTDGSYRWAGHEDDRFSSLVHNALADCALLSVAEVLDGTDDHRRKERYLDVVQKNIREYIIERLYSGKLGGFRMNPVDYYAGEDRFVTNMNSVAAEAMIRLGRLRPSDDLSGLAEKVGKRILSLQCPNGRGRGAFAYSHVQPGCFITIYTALTLRGLPHLFALTGDEAYRRAASAALEHFDAMRDVESGLWWHKMENHRLYRCPVFVSGAGMVCNGILDACEMTGRAPDGMGLAKSLLRYQLPNGALRNFIGYDHPDNGRPHGSGRECWEDVLPTPNWNAQAFLFLSRVATPPDPDERARVSMNILSGRRCFCVEGGKSLVVLGLAPMQSMFFGLYLKRLRYGLALSVRRILLPLLTDARRVLSRLARRSTHENRTAL